MSTLREIQKGLMASLTEGDELSTYHYVKPDKNGCSKTPIRIHQQSHFGKQRQALQEIYTVFARLVGEDFFSYVVRQYLDEDPNLTFDIHLYGKSFPEFIASFEPCQSYPYLKDMAEFEWLCYQACFSPPYRALDLMKLQKSSLKRGADLYFSLPQKSALYRSSYPILKIWENNLEESQ